MMTRILMVLVVATGCNSMLGVANVDLEHDVPDARTPDAPPPDASRVNCKLDEHYASLSINDDNSLVSVDMNGSPSMFIELNNIDGLLVQLRDNQGGHGQLKKLGSYPLSAQDAQPFMCGICVIAGADYNGDTKAYAQRYVARQQGQLMVSTATTTQLSGYLQNVVVRHVDIDSEKRTTTDSTDGCTTTFDQIDFNVTLGAPALISPGAQALHDRLAR